MISARKYLYVFIITAAIFAIAFAASTHLQNKKTENVKNIQDKIATDILSLETQFELLQESTCKNIERASLAEELTEIGDKLSYAESQNDLNNEYMMTLKKYYSILQIKDFLLMKKVDQKCATNPVVILYFYSNKNDCPECEKQGYVLTRLRREHPDLRVYSFDYNLDMGAIKTLVSLYHVPTAFPVLVMNEKAYSGFQDEEAVIKVLPELKPKPSTTKATSTPTTTPAKR